MDRTDGGFFETDSPSEAARYFRYSLGVLIGSIVFWAAVVTVYVRTGYLGSLPSPVVMTSFVVGVVLELAVVVAFVGCAIEYGSWIGERVEWLG